MPDHLGKVRTTFTDFRDATWTTGNPYNITALNIDLVLANEYYPFGMLQPKLSFQSEDYRFGFNGMLKDDEVMKASGGPYPVIDGLLASYSTEYRQYDPLLGRWKSQDPLRNKYPSMSPFSGYGNNPIIFVDENGLGPKTRIKKAQEFVDKNIPYKQEKATSLRTEGTKAALAKLDCSENVCRTALGLPYEYRMKNPSGAPYSLQYILDSSKKGSHARSADDEKHFWKKSNEPGKIK